MPPRIKQKNPKRPAEPQFPATLQPLHLALFTFFNALYRKGIPYLSHHGNCIRSVDPRRQLQFAFCEKGITWHRYPQLDEACDEVRRHTKENTAMLKLPTQASFVILWNFFDSVITDFITANPLLFPVYVTAVDVKDGMRGRVTSLNRLRETVGNTLQRDHYVYCEVLYQAMGRFQLGIKGMRLDGDILPEGLSQDQCETLNALKQQFVCRSMETAHVYNVVYEWIQALLFSPLTGVPMVEWMLTNFNVSIGVKVGLALFASHPYRSNAYFRDPGALFEAAFWALYFIPQDRDDISEFKYCVFTAMMTQWAINRNLPNMRAQIEALLGQQHVDPHLDPPIEEEGGDAGLGLIDLFEEPPPAPPRPR